MFDFHMHTRVSFDGKATGLQMAQAAAKAGLKEICFTDHLDYDPMGTMPNLAFDTEAYNAEYDHLEVPGLIIRRGMEFGMTPDNKDQFREDLKRRPFDFVLGSIHFVDGLDVYYPEYWKGKTLLQAETRFLESTLASLEVQEDFDVLAHLTFLCKATANPIRRPMLYEDHRLILDQILRTLAAKEKGMEMNTSGMTRCGGMLPTADFFVRFRQLGGRIVTVGSDAHNTNRVGEFSFEACRALKDIFGHVCTFEDRKPIFHTLP